jgi:hypothetical protein
LLLLLSLLFPLPFWTLLLLLLLHTRLASSSPLHLLISALLHCLSLSLKGSQSKGRRLNADQNLVKIKRET